MSDFVQIPRAEYDLLCARSAGRRAMAQQNLHTLLHETEQGLKRERERARQFELAFHRTEARLGNVLRRQLSNLRVSQETRDTQDAPQAAPAPAAAAAAARYPEEDDLEEDGCSIYAPPPPSHHSQPCQPVAKMQTQGGISGLESGLGGLSIQSEDESVYAASSSSEGPDTDSARQPAEMKSISVQTETTGHDPRGLFVPGGVSQSYLDKVLKENGSLRDILEDVLQEKGSTIQSYLDYRQYENIIKQLRSQLNVQKERIAALEQQLAADPEVVRAQCIQLQQELEKRDKALVGRQALLETVYAEYNSLKSQGPHSTSSPEEAQQQAAPADAVVEQQLRAELESKDHDLAEMKKKIGMLKTEVQRQESKIEELQGLNYALQAQVQQFEADFKNEAKDRQKDKERLGSELRTKDKTIKKKKVPTATLR